MHFSFLLSIRALPRMIEPPLSIWGDNRRGVFPLRVWLWRRIEIKLFGSLQLCYAVCCSLLSLPFTGLSILVFLVNNFHWTHLQLVRTGKNNVGHNISLIFCALTKFGMHLGPFVQESPRIFQQYVVTFVFTGVAVGFQVQTSVAES
jgi:hypothetical protein